MAGSGVEYGFAARFQIIRSRRFSRAWQKRKAGVRAAPACVPGMGCSVVRLPTALHFKQEVHERAHLGRKMPVGRIDSENWLGQRAKLRQHFHQATVAQLVFNRKVEQLRDAPTVDRACPGHERVIECNCWAHRNFVGCPGFLGERPWQHASTIGHDKAQAHMIAQRFGSSRRGVTVWNFAILNSSLYPSA